MTTQAESHNVNLRLTGAPPVGVRDEKGTRFNLPERPEECFSHKLNLVPFSALAVNVNKNGANRRKTPQCLSQTVFRKPTTKRTQMAASEKLLLPVIRLACLTYWALLSVLLLVPDPLALFGIRQLPGPSIRKLEHLLLFTVLMVLVHASRFPVGRVLLAVLLVSYAIVTEGLQLLVPQRSVELLDFVENLGGLAAGTAVWWIANRAITARSNRQDRKKSG